MRRPGADRREENVRWNRSPGKRNAQLKNRYGITLEQYERMLEQQGGVCALCDQPCSTGQNLSVDHCHETGEVRGLLCRRCNTAIAREDEFPGWMSRASAYVKWASMKPRVSVDWDGVCVKNDWPNRPTAWLPGAKRALRALDELGYEIVIFSCRVAPVQYGTDDVPRDPEETAAEIRYIQRMLDRAGLGHVEIWTRPYKPPAVAYIDDRAVAFTGSWRETLRAVIS